MTDPAPAGHAWYRTPVSRRSLLVAATTGAAALSILGAVGRPAPAAAEPATAAPAPPRSITSPPVFAGHGAILRSPRLQSGLPAAAHWELQRLAAASRVG